MQADLEFQPPPGFTLLSINYQDPHSLDLSRIQKATTADTNDDSEDEELWLIKCPADFPLTQLQSTSFSIPTEYLKINSSVSATPQGNASSSSGSGSKVYTVKTIPDEDLGELKDFDLVLPSKKHSAHRIGTIFA
jgi:hypothetical protein